MSKEAYHGRLLKIFPSKVQVHSVHHHIHEQVEDEFENFDVQIGVDVVFADERLGQVDDGGIFFGRRTGHFDGSRGVSFGC